MPLTYRAVRELRRPSRSRPAGPLRNTPLRLEGGPPDLAIRRPDRMGRRASAAGPPSAPHRKVPSGAWRGADADGGFALLETVVAFAILALLATICFPRAGSQNAMSLRLLRTAGLIGTLLREDRNAALASGRIVAADVDLLARSFRSGATGERLIVDEALRLDARSGAGRSRHARLVFFPDGRSSGGSIDLRYGSSAYRIAIDAQTAAVTLVKRPGVGERQAQP